MSTFCTHCAIVKVVAGDPQSEAVFGYFYPADGCAGEELMAGGYEKGTIGI